MHIGVIGTVGSEQSEDDFYKDERDGQRAAESKRLLEQRDEHLRRNDTNNHEQRCEDDSWQGKLEDPPEQG